MKKATTLITLITLLSIFVRPVYAEGNLQKLAIPKTGAYFGLWASGPNGETGGQYTSELIDLLNKTITLKPVGLGYKFSTASADILNNITTDFKAIPMIHHHNPNRTFLEIATNTINPNDKRCDQDGQTYPCKQTKPDDVYHGLAAGLRDYGQPVLLRIFSEMNWNNTNNIHYVCDECTDLDTGEKITSKMLIDAWRHIYNIFKEEGADNVSFMWIQSTHYNGIKGNGTVAYDVLYPGDEYVDWVGWDLYNRRETSYTFEQIIDADYKEMEKIAPDKPMIICEFNSNIYDGDANGVKRAQWFTTMLTEDLPNKYPNIKGVSLFNIHLDSNNNKMDRIQDGSVVGGARVLKAFKTAIASPYYISSLPGTISILGDLTETGDELGDHVNKQDYKILKDNFGKTGANIADINNNGVVDVFDYNILVENFDL